MAVARRVPVDTDMVRRIITGIIVDKDFCRKTIPMLSRDVLDVAYAQRVVEWVRSYWETYEDAPGKELQDIFEAEREKLDEGEAKVITEFLDNLSKNYAETESHNWEYQFDRARDWVRRKAVESLTSRINGLVATGKLDQAEEQIRGFREVVAATTRWIDPYEDEDFAQSVIHREETNGLFKMEGQLGELLGPFQRSWVVAFLGPMKRGKTFWLTEFANQCVREGLKVAFISLEMNEDDMGKRMIQNMTALPDEEGPALYPVFDCEHNQDNSCELDAVRENHEPMPTRGDQPYFEDGDPYRPCTFCKDNLEYVKYYSPASWWVRMHRDKTLRENGLQRLRSLRRHRRRGALRFAAYPRFSANIEQLESDLEVLATAHDFVPDVIVIDYIDIVSDEGIRAASEREKLDILWKKLGKMAGEKRALVVSASQSNRESIKKRSVEQTHIAEDIRKVAHVDAMFSLNQMSGEPYWEKEGQRIRIGIVAHRHRPFDKEEAVVLQSLDIAQTYLDSYCFTVNARQLSADEHQHQGE